jgi:uroporphyrinogen-III synthase
MSTDKPLKDQHILITRPAEQSGSLVGSIESYGGKAVVIPMIRIVEPSSWERCDLAIVHMRKYDGIIFTSVHGADAFIGRVQGRYPQAFSLLARKKLYAVGSKTAGVLAKSGLVSSYPQNIFDAEHLMEMLGSENPAGKHFLFPSGNLRLDTVERTLDAMHAVVDAVEVYRTEKPGPEIAGRLNKLIDTRSITVVTFFSPSSVDNFFEIVDREKVCDIPVAVIGRTTADAVTRYSLKPSIQPDISEGEALVEAIVAFVQKSKMSNKLKH